MAKSIRNDDLSDVDSWNEEDALDLNRPTNINKYGIVVSSRDWTVATMVRQIQDGNIDLDPAFQRRNAWRDPRRSRLIESFILGFPIPQLVLAESPRNKGTFIVIDGKQRLLTIAGFFLEEYRDYWNLARLSGLNVLDSLNRTTIQDFLTKEKFASARRQLGNSDIRTTVITGFQDESVLYDIFYRINTGSVPLSSQELRQAIITGPFSKYILQITSEKNPIWTILKISNPDPRLRDVELLLRLIGWRRFASEYKGNMKSFLDSTMEKLNKAWAKEKTRTEALVKSILEGVSATSKVFGEHAGRKLSGGVYETSLNRALFEVQAVYFSLPEVRAAALKNILGVRLAFKKLSENHEFVASIESTTKSIENSRRRFEDARRILEKALAIKIPSLDIARG